VRFDFSSAVGDQAAGAANWAVPGPGRMGPPINLLLISLSVSQPLFDFLLWISRGESFERERSEMKEGSSWGGAAAGGNDPRQQSTAKPYAPPKLSPQDLPIDYAGFLAVVFGVVGVMLRVRNHLLATPLLTLSDLSSISE